MKAFVPFRGHAAIGYASPFALPRTFGRLPRRRFITSSKSLAPSPSSSLRSSFASSKPKNPISSFSPSRPQPWSRRPLREPQRRLKSTKETPTPTEPPNASPSPNPTPHLNSPEGTVNLSLSQRLRKLSREYGWSALGVYLLLSALDFPFCFAAVRMLGVDRIGHWEHIIVTGAKKIISYPLPDGTLASIGLGQKAEANEPVVVEAVPAEGSEQIAEPGKSPQEWSWGVEAAEEAHKEGATIWTQLALAYAIHKSFIFLRVPLTAAVTPKVVKVLRGWGWNIGKRRPKSQT